MASGKATLPQGMKLALVFTDADATVGSSYRYSTAARAIAAEEERIEAMGDGSREIGGRAHHRRLRGRLRRVRVGAGSARLPVARRLLGRSGSHASSAVSSLPAQRAPARAGPRDEGIGDEGRQGDGGRTPTRMAPETRSLDVGTRSPP